MKVYSNPFPGPTPTLTVDMGRMDDLIELRKSDHLAQAQVGFSIARLSDARETETTLALSGNERLAAWTRRSLGWLRYGPGRCQLGIGFTGDRGSAHLALRRARFIFGCYDGLYTGALRAKTWRKSRFSTPYLRNTIWDDLRQEAEVCHYTARSKECYHRGK